jgi:predicted TIM-barrel fold metal-dependent hydrolase
MSLVSKVQRSIQYQGKYLDDQKYWPIFERAEKLGVPINLHPLVPASSLKPYKAYGGSLAGRA